jgi:hypothetical protein
MVKVFTSIFHCSKCVGCGVLVCCPGLSRIGWVRLYILSLQRLPGVGVSAQPFRAELDWGAAKVQV